jgi:cytochrome c oxidase assembly protein subunit 15
VALIFLQLILGATMRHQHAGLAISDFPLAHGQWWPDISPEAIARYNAARSEIVAVDPITAAQVLLQMAHRVGAVLILGMVIVCFVKIRRAFADDRVLCRCGFIWLLLVLVQAGLGAWTVWSNKAADVATLHVVVGTLTLATGVMICVIRGRRAARTT